MPEANSTIKVRDRFTLAIKSTQRHVGGKVAVSTLVLMMIIGLTVPANAQTAGTIPGVESAASSEVGPASLDPVDPLNQGATFCGNGGWSADALGQEGTTGGNVTAQVPPGSTVVMARLYAATNFEGAPGSNITIDFDGTLVNLTRMDQGEHPFLDAYVADVTAQVAAKVGGGAGLTNFTINSDPFGLDGVALVTIFSNPALSDLCVAILEGALSSAAQDTVVGFAEPIDKSEPGFSAIMSIGSSFSAQDQSGFASHQCGVDDAQASIIDVNGERLTSCAGNFDDGVGLVDNGMLITVGGVGDNTANPSDPFQEPADGNATRVDEDELYNIADFINNGDTNMTLTTQNPSGDDQVFLVVLAITAQISVGEICGDGIDNDEDGFVDEGCEVPVPVGGEILGVDMTTLFAAGLFTSTLGWALPAVAAGIGASIAAIIRMRRRKVKASDV